MFLESKPYVTGRAARSREEEEIGVEEIPSQNPETVSGHIDNHEWEMYGTKRFKDE